MKEYYSNRYNKRRRNPIGKGDWQSFLWMWISECESFISYNIITCNIIFFNEIIFIITIIIWGESFVCRPRIQSDITLEFKKMTHVLESLDIIHIFACPYSHQQIWVVKQRHQHLDDIAVTMMKHTDFSLKFWDCVVMTITTFLYNRNQSITLEENL